MKRQSWNVLTRRARARARPLQFSLVLCGGVIAACGDTVVDSGNDAGPAAGQSGNSSKAGTGGNAGRAGNPASGAGVSGGAGRAGFGAAGASGQSAAGTSGSDVDAGADDDAGVSGSDKALSFFVTSDTSATGNLGGLAAADKRCQDLATAVAAGSKTWHAYLSVDSDAASGGSAVNARDRIGAGPWYNQKGVLLAQDLSSLHTLSGDAALFLDEKGAKINGQWPGSGTPNQHDILTGSNADGTLAAGKTCQNWTSAETTDTALVGHSDGLGPSQNSAPPYNSWNSVHEAQNCSDTAPRGGAGKLYCFAIN